MELGEPTGIYEKTVEEGTHTVPVGAGLAWPLAKDSDRVHLVILHVASVVPKP